MARACRTVLNGGRTLRRALVCLLYRPILRARVRGADNSRNNCGASRRIIFGRFWRCTACLLTTIRLASCLNQIDLAIEELLLLGWFLPGTFPLVFTGLNLRLTECKVLLCLTLGRWRVMLTILRYIAILARRLDVLLRGLGLWLGYLRLSLLESIVRPKRHIAVGMIFRFFYQFDDLFRVL